MKADTFNSLLKYSEVEHQGGDDYCLSSEGNDQFYFWFKFSDGEINDVGQVKLTERQLNKVKKHIYTWCDNKQTELNKEKEDYINFVNSWTNYPEN